MTILGYWCSSLIFGINQVLDAQPLLATFLPAVYHLPKYKAPEVVAYSWGPYLIGPFCLFVCYISSNRYLPIAVIKLSQYVL